MHREARHHQRESLPLDKEVGEILEESRMVLPGVQTLLGFQFIATFSDLFHKQLVLREQMIHLLALILVAISMAVIMTPAAYHRQAEPETVSKRFAQLATLLLSVGMIPLMFALALDVYVVSFVILHRTDASLFISLALLCLFATLWFIFPRMAKRRQY
ncbi:MAG TPA: DUF6328 family protein [Acidobacteriota bacterium]|nr:DUF6328 family protein [Acidobacteriota bacterium]